MSDDGTTKLDPGIQLVVDALGLTVPSLEEAATFSNSKLDSIRKNLNSSSLKIPKGLDVVFCGSAGRQELTPGSDADYFLLVTDPVEPVVLRRVMGEVDSIIKESGLKEAGAQGFFEEVVFAVELHGRIGLASDSYHNTTRRLLLLTESVSVLNRQVRDETVGHLLERYCVDHNPSTAGESGGVVPRFLLNDVLRYWRTIAVDFGAKRWSGTSTEMYPRYAKFLSSRKVLVAGALAMVFLPEMKGFATAESGPRYDQMITLLKEQVDRPPLARLCGLYPYVGDAGKQALGNVLSSYDRFLDIMTHRRDELKEAGARRDHELRQLVEMEIGGSIQDGLEEIFFGDPTISALTRRYGLF